MQNESKESGHSPAASLAGTRAETVYTYVIITITIFIPFCEYISTKMAVWFKKHYYESRLVCENR